VPLLVSDLGGLSEAVREPVGGWRFPAGDASALSRRLEELLLDPEQLEAVEIPPAPSAEVHFARLFDVYAEVLAEQGDCA
jgi:glycosyltransferase involved in cell wall biosynthesis